MLEEKQPSFTPLSEIGEFGLIDKIKSSFGTTKNSETVLGIGDDAAILSAEGKQILISTDLFTEGVHFNLQYAPLKHLGYKVVVSSISDLLAMNAVPSQILVSLGLSNRFHLESVDDLYAGIGIACQNYKLDLVGGDTTSSQSGLVISVTAIGYQEKSKIVSRSQAKEKDLIAVTGDLGAAYMGLQILERETSVWKKTPDIQPNLSDYPYVIERQLKPEARKYLIQAFSENNLIPSAMIDVSDGLSSELMHLSKMSKVGIRIYEDKIPLDPQTLMVCDEFKLNPTVAALHGGEDYEMLFTFPLSQKEEFEKIEGIRTIGYITTEEEGCKIISNEGELETELSAQGWNAFQKKENDL